LVIVTLIVGLIAAVPFGIFCVTLSKFLLHRIDMEDKQLKMAIIENNHAAWDEFDVKYKEQFEYEAGRQ
tara:strand:+ start:2166 stop:2372 length:207 start_codon:yes stop_codon:yes gene_type:complete